MMTLISIHMCGKLGRTGEMLPGHSTGRTEQRQHSFVIVTWRYFIGKCHRNPHLSMHISDQSYSAPVGRYEARICRWSSKKLRKPTAISEMHKTLYNLIAAYYKIYTCNVNNNKITKYSPVVDRLINQLKVKSFNTINDPLFQGFSRIKKWADLVLKVSLAPTQRL